MGSDPTLFPKKVEMNGTRPQQPRDRIPRRKYASHQRRSAAGQVMKRESIEERIKRYFKLEGGACASALSEVQDCFESSVYLDAILQEVGSSAATKEEAIVKWAIIRGEQWVGMSFLPGPTYTRKNLRGRWGQTESAP